MNRGKNYNSECLVNYGTLYYITDITKHETKNTDYCLTLQSIISLTLICQVDLLSRYLIQVELILKKINDFSSYGVCEGKIFI